MEHDDGEARWQTVLLAAACLAVCVFLTSVMALETTPGDEDARRRSAVAAEVAPSAGSEVAAPLFAPVEATGEGASTGNEREHHARQTTRPLVVGTKVSVMTFHDLSPQLVRNSLLTPVKAFEAMLVALRKQGYQTFFASEVPDLLAGRHRGLRPGCRPVVLTFDDGYKGNYDHLFPLLKRHRAKATIFLIVGKVVEERRPATPGALTWDEVREMVASEVVEVGTHTYNSHRNLVDWIRNAPSRDERIRRWRDLYQDLKRAREVAEMKVGLPVRTMAWPHGKRTSNHMKLATMAGYRVVFNTQFGTNVPGYCNLHDVRRISASSSWTTSESLLKRLWLAERGRGLDGRPMRFAWAVSR